MAAKRKGGTPAVDVDQVATVEAAMREATGDPSVGVLAEWIPTLAHVAVEALGQGAGGMDTRILEADETR